MCTEAEISIFSQGEANQWWGSKCQGLRSGVEHMGLLSFQEQPTLSMLRPSNPLLYPIQRLNILKLWKWGDYIQREAKLPLLSSEARNREADKGKPWAKESICKLEHWMDSSLIEELWWLQGLLLCGNAIGKIVTAYTIIRSNDLLYHVNDSLWFSSKDWKCNWCNWCNCVVWINTQIHT